MVRKTADEKRKDAREYMATYREHNPQPRDYNIKGNEKRKKLLKSLPSIECKCGGKYKNYPQCKKKHLDSYKHQAWYAEKQLTALMVEAGEAKDEAEAKRQLEKRLNTRCAYTDKSKVIAMDDIGENINNIWRAKNHTEKAKPRRKTKETHHEAMIRIAAEAQDSESSEEEPQNEIIEAEKSPPPTPCPSSSEAESESDETESETETPSEGTVSESSDDDEIDEVRQKLERDKEKAIQRFNRFKDAKVVEKVAAPPPNIDMSTYLEEASIIATDGSDILKKLGILTHNKKGNASYHFL
jgi:hypothetical protein